VTSGSSTSTGYNVDNTKSVSLFNCWTWTYRNLAILYFKWSSLPILSSEPEAWRRLRADRVFTNTIISPSILYQKSKFFYPCKCCNPSFAFFFCGQMLMSSGGICELIVYTSCHARVTHERLRVLVVCRSARRFGVSNLLAGFLSFSRLVTSRFWDSNPESFSQKRLVQTKHI
jgi:hypothetical protein